MVLEEMHLQKNKYFDISLVAKVTQNVTMYPLHQVTYTPVKFEVATSNRLGGDKIARNMALGSTSHRVLPSTLYII